MVLVIQNHNKKYPLPIEHQVFMLLSLCELNKRTVRQKQAMSMPTSKAWLILAPTENIVITHIFGGHVFAITVEVEYLSSGE